MTNLQRVSARVDLVGAIDYLIELEETNSKRIATLERATGEIQYLTIKDLCQRYGCRRGTLDRSPWLLPNFGRPDFGTSPRKWRIETVEIWEQITIEQHRADWELMSADDKRLALGVSA